MILEVLISQSKMKNIFRSADNESDMTEKTFSEVPHWMNLTFVDYDEDSELSQISEMTSG